MANLAYIQVTRQCNQECRFCSNPPTQKKRSLDFFKNLIDFYSRKKYDGVIFSGGEPTLYPHLPELIHYAHKKNFPARIITNGQKTADPAYLASLKKAGLRHIGLSLYSDDASIQAYLTKNRESLKNIKKSLKNFKYAGITVDIATVINKYNAGHLLRIVQWIVQDYPFVRHFVWNNLDPLMNRATRNKDTIPRLCDFELELFNAMSFLNAHHKTFRVERVPLCFMADFIPCSTETRKIVKNEERMVYFLDEKQLVRQKKWAHGKSHCCNVCSVTKLCAGLYQMDSFYSSEELYPLFFSKNAVLKNILNGKTTTL
ncbi:MAG: radical SAM protein [Pseudomonadota bacterium]